MNLVMASVLLLAMLAFQPTLIYGSKKNLASARTNTASAADAAADVTAASNRNVRSSKYAKRHSAESSALHPLYSPALSSSAKLVLSMDSGDEVLVRAVRGASVDNSNNNKPNPSTIAGGNSNGGAKRQKGSSNKKLNKNLATHESAAATSPTSSTVSGGSGRKHLEKKFSATSGLSSAQQQQPTNGKGKQRQMLKSQNHQGKRSGNNGNGGGVGAKAIRENADPLNGESEKTSTCRYSKSAWTECDTKTNMRSRTLNLKKGDASCQPTRTMQKKCKKSCRYEKGAWSECINGQMTREDKLKATGAGTESLPSSCEPVRSINKKCNPNNGASKQGSGSGGGGKKERKNKDKGSRRNQGQLQQ